MTLTGGQRGDRAYWTEVLRWLPTYSEVTVTWRGKQVRLMARDLPGTEDRRYTNLDSGTEWFLPFAGIAPEVTRVAVTTVPDIEVV